MKLYIKNEKGRYEALGEQWEGFPADGWWFVGDGRRNLVVPIDSPRPLEKLKFQQYRNELVDRLEQQQTARSLTQFVEDVLDLLEEVINVQDLNHSGEVHEMVCEGEFQPTRKSGGLV